MLFSAQLTAPLRGLWRPATLFPRGRGGYACLLLLLCLWLSMNAGMAQVNTREDYPEPLYGTVDSLEAEIAQLRERHLRPVRGRDFGKDKASERREWERAYRAFGQSRDSLLHAAELERRGRKEATGEESLSLQSLTTASTVEGLVPDSVEYKALVDLYNSTNGAAWTNRANWLTGSTSADLDTWHGITVTNGDVSQIDIRTNNLVGPIPASLGNLAGLAVLRLSSNSLSGAIPSELGNLANLGDFTLWNNKLTGAIPASFGRLTNLLSLSLGQNSLSGEIPSELGNLVNLVTLHVSPNSLSGAIPSELGNLRSLQRLDLSNNQLSGSVPSSLGNLTNLVELRFWSNKLTGEIPASLGKLSKLKYLYFTLNHLSGPIPPELGNLKSLLQLGIYGSSLSGEIPASLGRLVNLEVLDLQINRLSGPVPDSLGYLTKMRTMGLAANNLSGALPTAIGGFAGLTSLSLQAGNGNYNAFTSIPDFSGNPNRANITLTASSNRLDFGSIEPNMSGVGTTFLKSFSYYGQGLLGRPDTLAFETGRPLSLVVATPGARNLYQWQRQAGGAWQDIAGATSATYSVPSASVSDAGVYRCRVTNAWATSLTLHTHSMTVTVTESLAPDMNYIVTHTLQEAGVTESSQVPGLPVEEQQQTTVYFDGLGRPIQQVGLQASPGRRDLVQPMAYDAFGRQDRTFLPYAAGTDGYYKEGALTEVLSFYNQGSLAQPNVATTGHPFAQAVFEASPLNRVTEQGAAGEAWQPHSDSIAGSGHTVKNNERANLAEEGVPIVFGRNVSLSIYS